jgi:hypothetical protein
MCKASATQTNANVISAGGMLGFISGEFGKFRRLVQASRSQRESPIQVPKMHSVFHPLAQSLRRSPSSNRLCRTVSELRSELARLKQIMGTVREALRCIDTYSYKGGMRSDAEKKPHAQLAEFMTKGF